MHSSISTILGALALALALPLEAALRFTAPTWRADLGISLPCLEGAEAVPLHMPQAQAYLVSNDDGSWLEDRYDSLDLWTGYVVRGRWRDAFGNGLIVALLDSVPTDNVPGAERTRRSFHQALARQEFDPHDVAQRDTAVAYAAPEDVERAVKPRRSQRKNLAELVCYPPRENERMLVYAFRPRCAEAKTPTPWYLAVLVVDEGESMAEVQARFDEEFLDKISMPSANVRRRLPKAAALPKLDASEAEWIRHDVRANVANYDAWHACDSEDVCVLDNLDSVVRNSLVGSITNNLPRLRRAYAESVPSPLIGTNAIAVVRVFRSREEYLAYVGVEQKWTSALWAPQRRELVLYHPEAGNEKLLRTVWHEAFHQYVAYAGAMAESSPWFNEGHAQLFENSHLGRKGEVVFEREGEAATYVHANAAAIAAQLPAIFTMDYREFYSGTQEEIAIKYHIAWSIAYFLEVGAPKLRFQPYADFRARYMKALVSTRSMTEATGAVLGDEKKRDAFIADWQTFWSK